jgi:hypothetical protein
MSNRLDLHKLLRESGFKVEDFPEYLRADFTLISYAKRFPREMRAEYLTGLLQFFQLYEQLDEHGRAQMFKRFKRQLRKQFARKRRDH